MAVKDQKDALQQVTTGIQEMAHVINVKEAMHVLALNQLLNLRVPQVFTLHTSVWPSAYLVPSVIVAPLLLLVNVLMGNSLAGIKRVALLAQQGINVQIKVMSPYCVLEVQHPLAVNSSALSLMTLRIWQRACKVAQYQSHLHVLLVITMCTMQLTQ